MGSLNWIFDFETLPIANLNEYLHILSGSKANDIDLDWILKLRINKGGAMTALGFRKGSQTTFANPPSVFFKQTEVSKKRKIAIEGFNYDGNHADVGVIWCNGYRSSI